MAVSLCVHNKEWKCLNHRGLEVFNTLQEHQTIPTNATVSTDSDIENVLWSMRKNRILRVSEKWGNVWLTLCYEKILGDREIQTTLGLLNNI